MRKKKQKVSVCITEDCAPGENAPVILSRKLRVPEKEADILIFSSGLKKSEDAFFIPNLLQMNASFVITDPEGRMYRKTKDVMEQGGYRVRLFAPEMPESDCFNPISCLRADEDVELLTECFLQNTKGNDMTSFSAAKQAFFLESEGCFFAALLYLSMEQEETLFSLMEKTEEIRENFSAALNIFPEGSESEKCMEAFSREPGKEEVVASVLSRFRSFLTPETASLTCAASHSNHRSRKEVLYLVPDRKRPFLTAAALTMLLRNSSGPLRFFFPDVSCAGHVPNLFAVFSEENSSAFGFTGIRQMGKLLGGAGKTLMECCPVCLFMGTQEKETLPVLSNQFGWSDGKKHQDGTGVKILTSETLSHLSEGECFVLSEYFPVYEGKIFSLREHPYAAFLH